MVSQYIGSREKEKSSLSAGQLVMISALFSLVLMAVILLLNRRLLGLLFGEVEEDVMEACVTYLRISAYSYRPLPYIMQVRPFTGAWERPMLPCTSLWLPTGSMWREMP